MAKEVDAWMLKDTSDGVKSPHYTNVQEMQFLKHLDRYIDRMG